MVKKKSDIWNSLIKIRDENRSSYIYPLSIAIAQMQMEGYLTACVDYGIITRLDKVKISNDFEKYW